MQLNCGPEGLPFQFPVAEKERSTNKQKEPKKTEESMTIIINTAPWPAGRRFVYGPLYPIPK